MRPFMFILSFCLPCLAFGQDTLGTERTANALMKNTEYRLGGAATRSATVATAPVTEADSSQNMRLTLPTGLSMEETSRRESSVGPATVFLAEGLNAGREAVELGTFLSRGQARAGVSVTYLETEAEVARSELFLDYALTEQFSIGVSGILDTELRETEPVRQLGLNAEFSTSGGAYVQGGVAGASDFDTVVGLSVGLRF